MQKAEEFDPHQCQAVTNQGQCIMKANEGSQFCLSHGGIASVNVAKKASLKNYRLKRFQQRAEEFAGSDGVNSLRDEIGILRILIEEKFNACPDAQSLLMSSGPLSDLITKVEKLTTSSHRLESRLGGLLDRTKVLQFAQMIIEIISQRVEEDVVAEIAEEIFNALGEL